MERKIWGLPNPSTAERYYYGMYESEEDTDWLIYTDDYTENVTITKPVIIEEHCTPIGSLTCCNLEQNLNIPVQEVTNILSIDIPVGSWIVNCCGSFSKNVVEEATGVRMSISKTSQEHETVGSLKMYADQTGSMIGTVSRCLKLTEPITLYLTASSIGASTTCVEARMEVMRIA